MDPISIWNFTDELYLYFIVRLLSHNGLFIYRCHIILHKHMPVVPNVWNIERRIVWSNQWLIKRSKSIIRQQLWLFSCISNKIGYNISLSWAGKGPVSLASVPDMYNLQCRQVWLEMISFWVYCYLGSLISLFVVIWHAYIYSQGPSPTTSDDDWLTNKSELFSVRSGNNDDYAPETIPWSVLAMKLCHVHSVFSVNWNVSWLLLFVCLRTSVELLRLVIDLPCVTPGSK